MESPIVASLKAWRDALTSGDAQAAVDHHDTVASHILEHKNSAAVFKAAGMNPAAFLEWNKIKPKVKEQLAKGPEQMGRDYAEAINQLDTILDSMSEASSARDVIKLAQDAQGHLRTVVMNASFLDDEEEDNSDLDPDPDLDPSLDDPEPDDDGDGEPDEPDEGDAEGDDDDVDDGDGEADNSDNSD